MSASIVFELVIRILERLFIDSMTEAKESAMSLLEMFVRANENRDFFTRFSFELVEKVNEEWFEEKVFDDWETWLVDCVVNYVFEIENTRLAL